ncbi:glycosyltransferase family 1 protein [Vibrio parahaemolyticus]|nr:glycosyltransferase family 1 protein [Vibrio parahaemolyticus]
MTKNFLCKAFRKLGAYPLIRLVDDRWSNIESVNFEGEDVAVFIGPQTPWSTFHQRPQNIAKELASSFFKVIYCIAPFDKNEPDCLIAGFKEIEPNLFLYSDIADWNVSGNVKIIYACYPWHYNQAKILKTLYPNAELIYDIFDDIDLFYKGSITIKQHKELIKLCDKVLYSADFLKPKDATSKCFYFPNAVDVGHFSNSKVLKKIGYFGAIDHWFDFKSVHEAVIENDDCVFFLCRCGC